MKRAAAPVTQAELELAANRAEADATEHQITAWTYRLDVLRARRDELLDTLDRSHPDG